MANYTFSNTSVITINDATANGPTAASLYPAAISVSGTTGVITGIQVKINGLNHQYADDIDILLVGPNGQKVLLMSDAGGDFSLTNINLTFSDSATSLLADNTQITSSGTYKPTDYQSGDSFPSSAPSGPYGTSLSAFNNATANGTWQLFVVDDLGGGTGTISSGWSLDITTAQPQPVQFNVSSLFNADGIVNRSNGVTDSSQNALDGSTTLITQSYATSAGGSNGNGLPDNGFFAANAYHPDIQLNYTNSNDGNNVRLLNSSNPSFTISVPQTKYSEVHLFAFSTNEYNNANSINVKLNYTDGSFTQVNTNVPDWFYNINETPDLYYLIDGLDRANFYSGSPSFENTDSAAVFGLRFTSDSTKTLQSIQVTQTSTSQANLVFLGSTGVPVSSYTPPSNTPPSLANPIPDTAATEDTPFSFTVTSNAFTDADGNTLTYSATQSNGSALPSWLTFNSTTRTFSGTPTNSDVATISVRVTASDGQATATDDFNITVNNVNDAPTATNLSTAETYTEDTLLNFTDIVVTDVDSANIIATLTLSNPAAGSFNIATSGTVTSTYNAATGVWTASGATANVNALLAGLTFTPAANFNSNFTIATSISDGVAPAITGTKTITGVPVNDPVTGSPTATLAAGTEDTAYTITAASLLQGFADADGNTLSVTGLTATNGAVVNNNNGTYTFTPNANYNGTVTFTYSVTDGNGSTLSGQTRSFALSAVNDAPVLTVPASQTVNEDTNFTLTGISIADVDALSSPLQVTLSANNGKLTFGNTTGLTFTSGGNNSNTMTFTGSLTDITNALNNLVYRSNLNYSGADTITLAVNDQGNTGTGEPLSDTKTIAVQVNVVNQTLSATTATDTINIGSGNDTINATFEQLQQNDQINVGLGIDTLILQGGISSNTITINLNNATNQVQNITGTTLLNFEKFDFSSFAGITQFTGGTGNDYIKAGLGNDSLVGGSGDDYLNGGAGNDTLNGGTGNDTMLGGVGNDSYTVDNIGDVVTENGNEGTDIVSASINYTLTDNLENLTLTGTAIAGTGNSLDNIITGNSANNILNGGAGNDTLNGSTGNDTMLGGAGNDSYSVDNIGDVVTENANEGIDIVSATINYTLTDNLENLTLTGTAITGTGNALDNTITGNAGNNILNAGDGNDTLNGGVGTDIMSGGAGNDLYYVDNTGDVVTENANEGTDTVSASITYTLTGNVENLTLTGTTVIDGTGNSLDNIITGNGGKNILNAGDGNDTLNGGAGADTMLGGTGNDSYIVDIIGDVVTENANEGTDTVSASITYTLTDNVENLILTGTTVINGTGNSLDNSLTGNTANNTLDGGVGADTMSGGAGNDTYIVDNIGDVISENANEGTDTVSAAIDYTLSANVENLTLTGSAIAGTGNTLNNTITGNAGDNIIDGGVGNDSMSGGAGNDTYIVDSTGDVITEAASAGTDTVAASINYTLAANLENLILTGTAVSGTGNTVNNSITGNSADNIINGGTGADTMLGGAGNDLYYVEIAGDVISENANEGTDTVSASITYTLTDNVENLILTGTTAINGTGNSLANSLTGNTANNTLDGGVGADTMSGGAGNDTYIVDNIGDVISENANEGTDTVSAAISYTLSANVENLTLTGSAIAGTGNTLNNTITGNAGDNIIDGGAGNDSMSGGAGNDTYIVDSTGDVITEAASAGTDTVAASINYTLAANLENLILTGTAVSGTGNTVNNSITGNSADNIINGGTGADTMLGGAGNDLYYVDNTGDVVTENANEGTDTVSASISYTLTDNVENLILTGTTAINGTGNSLANSLTGNTANNTLDGGVGADTMSGGAGNDTYIVDHIGDVISENANEGTDTVSANISYTLTDNVENLILTGTAAINGTGNTLNNTITGNAGDNIIDGAAGNDTMVGGAGNDTYIVDSALDVVTEAASAGTDTVAASINYTLATNLENLILSGSGSLNGTGNTLNNSIIGNSGNNAIDGGTGADTMSGGTGNDSYTVDNAGDVVNENVFSGTDTVSASINYTLTANVENLTLTGTAITATGNDLNNTITGNSSNNILNGGVGNDILNGVVGADTMSGGAGNDLYYVDNAGDVVSENANEGIDTVTSTISYTLTANVENLTLTGTTAINGTGNVSDNSITGNSANNILNGGDGNDTLNGGAGNDNLNGGAGNDNLNGGAGDDSYTVDDAGDVIKENINEGTDTVSSSISYILTANVENLILTGAAISGTGNSVDNSITGTSANNTLNGEDGNDTLNGGLGADTMSGGTGDDIYYVDHTGDVINENADAGSDTVFTTINYTLTDNIENLILTGTALSGTGNSVDNFITGTSANNTLNGGTGNDVMLGGAGNDSYYVDNVGDVVSENFAEGTDIIYSSSNNYTLSANVENLTLIATGLNGTGNNLNNLITGNSANNNLTGGGGNDILDGGLGADSLSGNAGNDIYYVDQPGDVVSENVNEGIDSVYSTINYTLTNNVENLTLSGSAISGTGNSVNNFITGNVGDNILNGEAGNDILNGGDGDDTLNGGDGVDTLFGGFGDDFYYVDNVGDVVNENVSEGTDTIEASVDYTLTENVENLTLSGTTAINATGNNADNIIIGNSGDNSLFGQDGNDILVGGDGNDILVGGLGADLFVFNSLSESEGIDTIQDFNVTDGDSIAILLGTATLNDFSYNDTTGGLFYQGTQFATIDNKPVDFSVDSHILLI